jgi:putative redox protein
MDITPVSASLGSQNYRTTISNSRHTVIGDEPTRVGGQDLGPDPYEQVIGGLAMCKAVTMRMYAARKGWELGDIHVHIDLVEEEGKAPNFASKITFGAPLSEEQQKRLLIIADKCPTHKLLAGEKTFTTQLG